MRDHLFRCNPLVCAVGNHVLLESKKEHVRKTSEATQQELVVKASEEAGLSKTVDVGQFSRTRAVCDARGRNIALYCKEFYKPRSIERSDEALSVDVRQA